MHELNQQIHTGVIGCNHVIRQQEINGNTQTVDNFYQLVQCKTSLAALNLSNVSSGYPNFLCKFLLSQVQSQALFANSFS